MPYALASVFVFDIGKDPRNGRDRAPRTSGWRYRGFRGQAKRISLLPGHPSRCVINRFARVDKWRNRTPIGARTDKPWRPESYTARIMNTFQAIFLGMMLAWTPSLAVLAWLIRRAPQSDDYSGPHHAAD